MDIVIFDVGKTLVRATHKDIILFLFKKRKVSLRFLLRVYISFFFHKLGLIKDENVNSISIKLFNTMVKGWNTTEIQKILNECFEKVIKPKIIPQSMELIKNHLEKKDIIILISAFIGYVIEDLKVHLNLKYAIYPKLEISNNIFTGKIIGVFPYGKDKAVLVKELINNEKLKFNKSYCYADRFSDRFLLEFVNNPCAINPDSNLRKLALQNGWQIYDFKTV